MLAITIFVVIIVFVIVFFSILISALRFGFVEGARITLASAALFSLTALSTVDPASLVQVLLPLMIAKALRGEPLPVYGDGGNIRDWLHVDDHCRGVDLLIDKGGIQQVQSLHVRFLQDEQVLKFTYRVDGAPRTNVAVTPNKGTDTQSPYIALAARS